MSALSIRGMSSSDVQVRDWLLSGDFESFNAAADVLSRNSNPDQFSLLTEAYRSQKSWDVRTDIIDLIRQAGHPETCAFLSGVARSRDHYLVRYYAMINIIEMDCGDWRPTDPRRLRTDYYASLVAYEKHIHGEMTLEAIHTLSQSRKKRNGDSWEWLMHLTKDGRK